MSNKWFLCFIIIVLIQQITQTDGKRRSKKNIRTYKYKNYEISYPHSNNNKTTTETPYKETQNCNSPPLKPPKTQPEEAVKQQNLTLEFDYLLLGKNNQPPKWQRMGLFKFNGNNAQIPVVERPEQKENKDIANLLHWLNSEELKEIDTVLDDIVKNRAIDYEAIVESADIFDTTAKTPDCVLKERNIPPSSLPLPLPLPLPPPPPVEPDASNVVYQISGKESPKRQVYAKNPQIFDAFNKQQLPLTIESNKLIDDNLLKHILQIVQQMD